MTLHGSATRLLAPGLLLVLAAVGYWTVFQGARPEPMRLSALVIERPGVAGLKKPSAAVVPATQTSWSEFRRAARADPGQTGGFSRTWQNTERSNTSLSVLVAYLPATSNATRLQNQVFGDYTDAKNLKADGISVTSRFTLPTVPSSQGVSYEESASSNSGAAKGSTVVFNAGRVVAVVYGTSGTTGSAESDVRAAVRQEHTLLQSRESGFSLSEATRSPLASGVYWLIAVGVAGVALVLPGVVQRERERRHARQAARSNYGRQARGSKVLRRQTVSPLLQPSRRPPPRPGGLSSKR